MSRKPHFSYAAHFIRHHVTMEETTVLQCLEKHFRLSTERAQELLVLGAVFSDKKRVESDRKLPKGTYLRIHLEPRRFAVDQIDWKKIIAHETSDFLIVCKPNGIPVHATADNVTENVLHQLRLAKQHHLLVTQRLDVPVSGLMVLAKTPDFQRRFNRWLLERKVAKRYLALVTSPPPLGLQVHFMEPSERSPRKVRGSETPGWLRCELTVHRVTELEGAGAFPVFEVEIELHTGRTHQIRAQLGLLESPILGDRMYGSKTNWEKWKGQREEREMLPLFSAQVGFPNPGAKAYAYSAAAPWGSATAPATTPSPA